MNTPNEALQKTLSEHPDLPVRVSLAFKQPFMGTVVADIDAVGLVQSVVINDRTFFWWGEPQITEEELPALRDMIAATFNYQPVEMLQYSDAKLLEWFNSQKWEQFILIRFEAGI